MPPSDAEMTTSHSGAPAHSIAVPDPWEAAYLRFETPEQEIRKFMGRLRQLGANAWSRDSEIVELFCGRGNGLNALGRLGFTRIEGVDLSPKLVSEYRGTAKCIVADCRRLPFADHCKDIVIVQGGLHHLPELPRDLDQTFAEMRRVLRKEGRAVLVEPWLTPFLRLVHWGCKKSFARRLSSKIDALATMIHHERRTYEQWLGQPDLLRKTALDHFTPMHESIAWGKWNFVGAPK